jgi:hypothetical protein
MKVKREVFIAILLTVVLGLTGCTFKEQQKEVVTKQYSDYCISMMNNFDNFILEPFSSNVGSPNENNQKEAEVIATLIEIGEPEFQPGKYGPSNYKRSLMFKGTNQVISLTHIFKDNSTLYGSGKGETQLDLLKIGNTYKLLLLANPPSPTVVLYLTNYTSYDCTSD